MPPAPTLPLVEGPITIDPKDPEVHAILSLMIFRTGPLAHVLQGHGYPIPCRAEDEQLHVLLWLLGLHRDHGANIGWRTAADNYIRAMRLERELQPR